MPNLNAKPRYILYLRVSTLEQNSDLQRRDLVEYAERRGWSYEVLEDKATGKNSNRPALKKLMALAQSRKIDGLCVWRADRLFRSLKEAVLAMSTLTELNVAFVSLKDGIDLSTAQGRLLGNMLFALAEFEAELIRSRVTAGLRAAVARGVKLGRPQVVTDQLVEQIVKLRHEGLSVRQITEALGRSVSKSSVERVLRNVKRSSTIGGL